VTPWRASASTEGGEAAGYFDHHSAEPYDSRDDPERIEHWFIGRARRPGSEEDRGRWVRATSCSVPIRSASGGAAGARPLAPKTPPRGVVGEAITARGPAQVVGQAVGGTQGEPHRADQALCNRAWWAAWWSGDLTNSRIGSSRRAPQWQPRELPPSSRTKSSPHRLVHSP
jgi:hypothetical protein